MCTFPLSLRQNCPYIDAKEIRLVDLNKTLVIEALSSLLTLFVHIFTCPCVGIRSVCCDHYENKALLSFRNKNLLISYLIFPFLYY